MPCSSKTPLVACVSWPLRSRSSSHWDSRDYVAIGGSDETVVRIDRESGSDDENPPAALIMDLPPPTRPPPSPPQSASLPRRTRTPPLARSRSPSPPSPSPEEPAYRSRRLPKRTSTPPAVLQERADAAAMPPPRETRVPSRGTRACARFPRAPPHSVSSPTPKASPRVGPPSYKRLPVSTGGPTPVKRARLLGHSGDSDRDDRDHEIDRALESDPVAEARLAEALAYLLPHRPEFRGLVSPPRLAFTGSEPELVPFAPLEDADAVIVVEPTLDSPDTPERPDRAASPPSDKIMRALSEPISAARRRLTRNLLRSVARSLEPTIRLIRHGRSSADSDAMAPPEALRELLADFENVEYAVFVSAGRRIRLPHPRGVVVCVGRRMRDAVRDSVGRDLEGTRLAAYLCCPEYLKFVGSILPADPQLALSAPARPLPTVTASLAAAAAAAAQGPEGRRLAEAVRPRPDPDNGVLSAAIVAAVALVGTGGVMYTPIGDGPAYLQPPELYLGSSGRCYLYMRTSRTDALCVVAESVRELTADGIYGVYLPVRRPVVCRGGAPARALTRCRMGLEVHAWQEKYGQQTRVLLGDGLTLLVCDADYAGCDPGTLEALAVMADVSCLDVVGLVADPPAVPPLVVLMDDGGRVYGAQDRRLVLVADDAHEFVECGLARYRLNPLFYGDATDALLSRTPPCPAGRAHGGAADAATAVAGLERRRARRRSRSLRELVTRVLERVR